MTSVAPRPPEFPEDRLQALAEAPITHSQLAAHLLGIPITEVTAEQRRRVKLWRFLRTYSVGSPMAHCQGRSLLDQAWFLAHPCPPVIDFKLEDLDFSTLEVRALASMEGHLWNASELIRTTGTYSSTGRQPTAPEWQEIPRSWK